MTKEVLPEIVEDGKLSRRRMVSTVLKGLAGSAVAITIASIAAPSVAEACECGQRCCGGSPVVR